jgi:drug/metabolite transporter (DMT)-like permease
MRERLLQPVTVAALISVLLWSSAFVAIRYAGRELGPGELALARLAVGSLVLGVAMLLRGERIPRGRALGFAVLSGLLWFGIYNLALNAAEQRIDAGTSALVVNTGPIFLALLAGRLLGEGYPKSLLTGCAVSFAGVALIAVGVSGHGLRATWGAALCLISAVVYAGGVVAQRPALRQYSALSVTWLACTVAAVACLPWAPGLVTQLHRTSAATVAWTVYLGVGPLAIGFGTWAFALARSSSAGRLGVSTYLVPPLVVLISWIALGQAPPVLALPGGILCLAGVALSRRRRPGRAPAGAMTSAVVVGVRGTEAGGAAAGTAAAGGAEAGGAEAGGAEAGGAEAERADPSRAISPVARSS